jgi:hypothetical protein
MTIQLTNDQARSMGLDAPKTNKHRNQWTEVDGRKFQSKKEAQRYCELGLMVKAGEIQKIECQVEYHYWSEDNERILFTYRADFRYWQRGRVVIEDVKPFDKATQKFRLTEFYRLKKKLIEDRYGIKIVEV